MLEEGVPYEEETTFAVYRILKPGDVFVDVGAHIGWFTLLAAEIVGPQGKVLAIEPEWKNYKRLQDNLELNNSNGNVEIARCVATSKNGRVWFHINDEQCLLSFHFFWVFTLLFYTCQYLPFVITKIYCKSD